MRIKPWITCCLGLVASIALAPTNATAKQSPSPYQANTRFVNLPPIIAVPGVNPPSPNPPIQPVVYQPIQPVASPPISPVVTRPQEMTVVIPYAPTPPRRPNNDNFLVRLVGHLIGPTAGDGAISETMVQVSNDNVSPSPAPILKIACASRLDVAPTNTNCCCNYRTYTPLTNYFSFFRFRTCEFTLGRLGPALKYVGPGSATPRLVTRDSSPTRALDNSFRNGPAQGRFGTDATLPPNSPAPVRAGLALTQSPDGPMVTTPIR